MKLGEFEDQKWFPDFLRRGMTDYLRFLLGRFHLYAPVVPLLYNALQKSASHQILDLCSGAGGASLQLSSELRHRFGCQASILLSDKYPNLDAFRQLNQQSGGHIQFVQQAVDATKVPPALMGFRTLFSSFHHFSRTEGQNIIQDAIKNSNGIAIFDGGNSPWYSLPVLLLVHPLCFLLFTPFLKPFRWKTLACTYLLPIIPICTIWDGMASMLKLHRPASMLQMALKAHGSEHYHWESGILPSRFGLKIAYLIGYPQANAASELRA